MSIKSLYRCLIVGNKDDISPECLQSYDSWVLGGDSVSSWTWGVFRCDLTAEHKEDRGSPAVILEEKVSPEV